MILVLGATGFLGKRVCEKLEETDQEFTGSSLSLGTDLRVYDQTLKLFSEVKPEIILNCASYVGGIQFGYKHPAELYSNNLRMNVNILEAAKEAKVGRIVNPISNCVYPAEATLFKEDEIWDGPMHDSVLVYGFVRKAFWIGSWAFKKQYGLDVVNLVLSNMYGPGDHFEAERSHALGALIMKFVKAKRNNDPHVDVWGSGKPVREWLHVDDGAESLIRAINKPAFTDFINVGVAEGISIIDMAEMIRKYVGYDGDIKLDPSKPDGAKYKTVDGTRGEEYLGWKPQVPFERGVKETINWYLENY
jgi:GDP-L-fucose synthase